jgi:7,8-dihydropterin-6-yl-methyl-4-(beta-D-ribofuranosyl)aminobenzene 5'-phosphate synthase
MMAVVALEELELVVVADNETDVLSSIDNAEQSSEVAGLLDRLEPSFVIDGHAHTSVFDHLCCACHGFSVLATGRHQGHERTVLFDVGPYGDIWLANAQRLGIDLSDIESVFLSHWHWDHSGGLIDVVTAIAAARLDVGRPPPQIDVHPHRPDRRGVQLPDGRVMLLPIDPTIDELEAAGAIVTAFDTDHPVADGFFHGSGEIARNTPFETGLAGHLTMRDGKFDADPMILDERFLSATVAGRGVTVLSACSHAGIINAATAAKQSADAPLDLVLGGYHLSGKAMEQRIPHTVRALLELDPKLVAPGHCTGWRAKGTLADAFSPTGRYAPSVVGTKYELTAPSQA